MPCPSDWVSQISSSPKELHPGMGLGCSAHIPGQCMDIDREGSRDSDKGSGGDAEGHQGIKGRGACLGGYP